MFENSAAKMRAYRQRKKLESKEKLAKQYKEARMEREKELVSSMTDKEREIVKVNEFLKKNKCTIEGSIIGLDLDILDEKDLEGANLTYDQFKEWMMGRYANDESYIWYCSNCTTFSYILDKECTWCKGLRPDTFDYRVEDLLERFPFASKWVNIKVTKTHR